uniref:DUF676 domain-containing protein n=1 Tax=Aegilops tauschii subsp. strangulata TaxID=200361 RepID=A0A453PT46_AEGTS
ATVIPAIREPPARAPHTPLNSSNPRMPASSRLCAYATCSLAASPVPTPPSPPLRCRLRRRHRRLASSMGQSTSSPAGGGRSRGDSRWPALRLDLGLPPGRKQRPAGERLDLGSRLRRALSRPSPQSTEVEIEAEEEGRDAGNRVEVEAGGADADHLVVMVNGLYGSSADWKFAAEQFVKRLPGKVYVHRSECNHSKLTYDGVDIMGERLAEEVHQVVQRKGNLRKISIVAHSLGGLISRYAIGRLYEESTSEEPCLNMEKHSDEENISGGGKIAGLEPMNFIASATPHLGSRWNKQVRFRAILCIIVGTNTILSVGGQIYVC